MSFLLAGLTAIALLFGAGSARAQLGPDDSDRVAKAALSALSVAALPLAGTNTISVIGASGDQADFFSTRIGGGRNLEEGEPLYLEGFVAYQSYTPIFILGDGDPTLVNTRWSSLALSGGVGWDFPVAEDLVLRPIALGSVGHVFGRAIFEDLLPPGGAGDPQDFFDDGLFAAGLGGAVALQFDRDVAGTTLDLRARQSWMRLTAIGETDRFGVQADAIPGARVQGLPLSGVMEAGYPHFWADQQDILRTDWLAMIGAGFAVATPENTWGGVTSGRLTLRYLVGDDYDGLSFGLGFRF